MDRLKRYRGLVKDHIRRVAELVHRNQEPEVQTFCIFDDDRDQYLLLRTGWDGNRRIRGISIYVRLHAGKIWVEEDRTDDGIVNALLKTGVPASDLVLGFLSPGKRRRGERAAV
jgi:hypothetical protein